jgi:uncharacterized protein (TIGR00369 family)
MPLDPKLLDKGLTKHLGIQLVEATAEQVVATMPVTPDHHQPFGYLHGGASVVLAESVASIGGSIAAGEGKACFGMEINANHLRPKKDGMLRATGKPIHIGRTSQVWDIHITDEADKLVCISRCTLAVVNV